VNQLSTISANLPSITEDIARFILVGREKLTAVRAEIRAIDRLQLAQEVRDQKRDEARMLSEALLDAEVRIGQLFKQMPLSPGARTDLEPKFTDEPRLMTKQEATAKLGFDSNQVKRFETLASPARRAPHIGPCLALLPIVLYGPHAAAQPGYLLPDPIKQGALLPVLRAASHTPTMPHRQALSNSRACPAGLRHSQKAFFCAGFPLRSNPVKPFGRKSQVFCK